MTIKDKDLSEQLAITVNPEKYGYIECPDCDGYGGTIRNSDIALNEICGECGGDGVIPKKEEKTDDDDQG